MGLLGLIGLLGLLGWGTAPPQGQDLLHQPSQSSRILAPSRPATRPAAYGQLPLSFEANQGQTDGQVQFLAHGQGYTLFLTAREAVLAFRPLAVQGDHPRGLVPKTGLVQDAPDTARSVVRMQLLGANPAPKVTGLEELPGKANYFIGNDPHKWRTHVPTYAKVKYAAVYPGVDLVYYGHSRQLEYDFLVAPGVDPTAITLGVEGIDRVDVDAQGDLVLATAGGSLRFQKPVVYQEGDGGRRAIAGGYVRKANHQVGFHVAGYDPGRPLVIDPLLSYATYLGGSNIDQGNGIAVDSAGAAYVTGTTDSSDFPTIHPLQPAFGGGLFDAFVAKLTPDGAALVYATYLGGGPQVGGGGQDGGSAISVDGAGAAYVTGFTDSRNFPTVHPLQPTLGGNFDAFVAKLTPDGAALVYATYLGGSGLEDGRSIAVDGAGAAYITGDTDSSDFPTVDPLQSALGGSRDAFVAKLTADGAALVYATYLGGSELDQGTGIAVDGAGAAYITGLTGSPDFPTMHPLQPALGGFFDAFVAKLNATGSALVYATYLGGRGLDVSNRIAVDRAGAAYIAGTTDSSDFPTMHPLQPALGGFFDAFVAKLNATGSALVYATYLGGRSDDQGLGIAVDATGAAYVTGFTFSIDFPTVLPLQAALGGVADAFVAKLNTAGSALVYATYLGGRGFELSNGIAVDRAGAAYIAGTTDSSDFPTMRPLQPALGGSEDAFVAKISAAPTFAGTPGTASCHGKSVSALTRQFGSLDAAASALGFPSVQALQDAIGEFCEE